jgi:hypothetical protein
MIFFRTFSKCWISSYDLLLLLTLQFTGRNHSIISVDDKPPQRNYKSNRNQAKRRTAYSVIHYRFVTVTFIAL